MPNDLYFMPRLYFTYANIFKLEIIIIEGENEITFNFHLKKVFKYCLGKHYDVKQFEAYTMSNLNNDNIEKFHQNSSG